MGDSQPSGSNGSISQRKAAHHAAEGGDVENGEDGSNGELSWYSAAQAGDLDALKLLLPENTQKIDLQTKEGWSALHISALCGQARVVQWLGSERRANLNLQDGSGFTPLHLAVAFGHKEVVRSLVSQGAKLFIPDKENMFPVSYCKDPSIFDALLSNRNSRSTSFNKLVQVVFPVDAKMRTILHYAAEYGSDTVVIARLITEAHADQVYDKDERGDSFLHVAAKSGNVTVLQALKALDPDHIDMARLMGNRVEPNPINFPPGMYALLYDRREFFEELVTMCKVEITLSCIIKALLTELIDKPEMQPRLELFASTLPTYLALCAKKNFIFDFLLETNLLRLSQWDDEYYRTCLHWAVVDNRTDIVQKLCSNAKLWPGIQDRDGKTALQHAFEQKNHMVMEILSGKRTFKEHEDKLNRDREVYVQALNAILVGAALIASVAFAGWLQLPYNSEFNSLGLKIYWASNSASFFTAVATMCVTTTALLPTPSRYVGDIVNQLRFAIVIAAALLALSLASVMWAFAAAGFAALRHSDIFAYQVIMRSITAAGGWLCLIVWVAFVLQLFKCTPPKSVLFALVLPPLRLVSFAPAWLQNLRAHVGDSSRSGFPSTKRSELVKFMDKDLVALRANQLNPITHAPPASKLMPISLETMKRVLGKLNALSDKEMFLEKIHEQREADIALAHKQKSGGAIDCIARRFGMQGQAADLQFSPKLS